MATTETVATTYDCDHSKCNKGHTVREGETPPGIVLTVETAKGPEDVYACGRSHVGPAVLAVIDATAADGADDLGADGADDEAATDADDVTGGNDALHA